MRPGMKIMTSSAATRLAAGALVAGAAVALGAGPAAAAGSGYGPPQT